MNCEPCAPPRPLNSKPLSTVRSAIASPDTASLQVSWAARAETAVVAHRFAEENSPAAADRGTTFRRATSRSSISCRVSGKLGIAALKIEGRMKSASYAYTVVSAFRMLLDGTCSVDRARELLEQDLCRPKTVFFLNGLKQPGVIDATRSGVGRRLGKVLDVTGDSIVITPGAGVEAGDRIRVDPRSGFEGGAAEVRSVSPLENGTRLRLKTAIDCTIGEEVFLIARKNGASAQPVTFSQEKYLDEKIKSVRFQAHYPSAKKALAEFQDHSPIAAPRHLLWIKVDSLAWLDLLMATPCQRLILACGADEMEELLTDEARRRTWKSRLVPAPPPFIAEGELARWRTLLDRFHRAGIRKGMCLNIGHTPLFGKRFDLIADASLWCVNRASQAALHNMGFGNFAFSWEDDYLNIKATAAEDGIAYLFSMCRSLFPAYIPPLCRAGNFPIPMQTGSLRGKKTASTTFSQKSRSVSPAARENSPPSGLQISSST